MGPEFVDYTPYGFSTIAGSPTLSAGLSDGLGSAAEFDQPMGVVIDDSGNAFVADSVNQCIRVVTPSGAVSTMPGWPAIPAPNSGGILIFTSSPQYIAKDYAGNLYVTVATGTVKKVAKATGDITTLAGNTGMAGSADGQGANAQFNGLAGIAVDQAGNVYVVDSFNRTIRKISSTGAVTTLAGSPGNNVGQDGTGSSASFGLPTALALDLNGNLLVGDGGLLRKVTPAGVVTTVNNAARAENGRYEDGPILGAYFAVISSIAVDANGNIFIVDSANCAVRKISPSGWVTTLGGMTTTTPMPSPRTTIGVSGSSDGSGQMAEFNSPEGIAVDASGTVYVSDTLNNTIRVGRAAPVIVLQPASQTTFLGGSATFAVQATGGSLSYQWYFNATPIPDATASMTQINNISTDSVGQYSVKVTDGNGWVGSDLVNLSLASNPAANSQLINLSVRANVGTGESSLIAGFVINASGTKTILSRAVGPGLSGFGITTELPDPEISLISGIKTFGIYSGWTNYLTNVFSDVGAFALDGGSTDTASENNLWGMSYTNVIQSKTGKSGIVLAELYDVDRSPANRLINLSARGYVDTGDKAMIGGFAISGGRPEKVLIRAIGPSLSQFGVTSPLANPVLTLYDSSRNIITTNSSWSTLPTLPTGIWSGANVTSATSAVFSATGAFQLVSNSHDAAFVASLPAGTYTAVVSVGSGAPGVALVEVYEVAQ